METEGELSSVSQYEEKTTTKEGLFDKSGVKVYQLATNKFSLKAVAIPNIRQTKPCTACTSKDKKPQICFHLDAVRFLNCIK